MKKILRVGYNRYYCDENFNEHITYIKRNLPLIDEVTLFAEFSHYGYWDDAFVAENTAILKKRIATYRELGIKSVGVNLLDTRGHIEEGWDVFPKTDLPHEVDANGVASKCILCVGNTEYEAYISKRYAAYANIGADFIWIDDDLRLGNGGLGCMCDSCISGFNTENGFAYNRTELNEKIRTDRAFKQLWLAFQNRALNRAAQVIQNAIKEANPDIKIGLMTIKPEPQLTVSSGAVMVRPGGGFYDDRTPLDLFLKIMHVQKQTENFPKQITDIQYEYEAFNYQSLNRSMHLSELESTLALMSGCNGVLYNNDIFYDRQSLLDMIAKSAKKWDALTARNEKLRPAGVYCHDHSTAKMLNEAGIPITFDLNSAVCCFLEGNVLEYLDAETIEKMLSKGMMTDGKGLKILCEKGFTDVCGGTIKNAYDNGMAERFADHPLCGNYKNHYRDACMNFEYYIHNSGLAYELNPSAQAETVSYLETITHKKVGCSFYIYEEKVRFATDGYLFRNSANTYAKKEQLVNVLDWVSKEKLPVKTKETIKIMPTVKADAAGNMTIMLINASFDKTGSFECEIRNDKKFYILGEDGNLQPIQQTAKNDNTVVTVDNIDGWSYVLLTNME